MNALTERFEFRDIHAEEVEQAVIIEQICFPPNEACSEKHMKERIAKAPELFLVAVDKKTGKIAGFLNGLSTDEDSFRDEFFTDVNLYNPDGKNIMLLGLDVLPEYRGQGLAREIVHQYIKREQKKNRKMLLLTCLQSKVEMYEKFGFQDEGIANSTWGGEEWHEMSCVITHNALKSALAKARTIQPTTDAIRIELADGVHKIEEPIVIDGADFGRELIITSAEGACPVLDGKIDLEADKFVKEGEYFVYRFQSDSNGKMPVFHDFYDNGKKIPICRSEYSILRDVFPDRKNRENPANLIGLYVEEDSLNWLDKFTSPVEFHIFLEWEYYMLHAIDVDKEDFIFKNDKKHVRLKFKPNEMLDFAKYHHSMLSIENRLIYYSNHPALLKPGTWCYDLEQGILYYMPENGVVEAPAYSVTSCLIEVKNAQNVHFENLTFTGTGCVQPAIDGYMSGQANTECRYGVLPCSAVLLRNTKDISFENCTFTELGSNGIQSVDRSENILIHHCTFKNNMMSAISLGNHNRKWLEEEANYDYKITNNYMEHIGMEYPTCPGIYIAHIDGLKLMHNTIRDVAYSGISVGWRWDTVTFGYGESVNIKDAEIAYNRIEDFMKLLRDGGAIYVVGGNCKVEHTELFNSMHHNFAVRPQDAEWKNCSRGYYLDGSSSNWYVHDNVTSGAIRPLFIQYVVEEQFCHNVLAEKIYSTDKISPANPAPKRNVIARDCYVVSDLETLFEQYPETKEIYENSGCDFIKDMSGLLYNEKRGLKDGK